MTRIGRYVQPASNSSPVRLAPKPRPDYAADITLVRAALLSATPEARAAFDRIVARLVDLAGERKA